MIPSYDELFEAYLICDKERYELLDKKHELEAKQIINEQEIDRLKTEISRIMEIIDLNQYNYGYQIKEDIESTSGENND